MEFPYNCQFFPTVMLKEHAYGPKSEGVPLPESLGGGGRFMNVGPVGLADIVKGTKLFWTILCRAVAQFRYRMMIATRTMCRAHTIFVGPFSSCAVKEDSSRPVITCEAAKEPVSGANKLQVVGKTIGRVSFSDERGSRSKESTQNTVRSLHRSDDGGSPRSKPPHSPEYNQGRFKRQISGLGLGSMGVIVLIPEYLRLIILEP